MKRVLIALGLLLSYIADAGPNSWSLASPDDRCRITVTLATDAQLTYQVERQGKVVLLASPLGIRRSDGSFERGLALAEVGTVQRRHEAYDLWAGTTPHVERDLNFRSVTFYNPQHARVAVDLAASDEGVAFRYRFAETNSGKRIITSELTGFRVPSDARGWLQPYHAAGNYTPAYEDFYFNVAPGELPPESRAKPRGWAFPALFHVPSAESWMLLTESGTDESYCACHLGPDSRGGLYRIAFPAADEATQGQTNRVGPEPRWTLPWTLPWRVIVLGGPAAAITTATLVTDLAPPCQIPDPSWIHPGRASWAWWSHPDGPATVERFNQFSDFGARMKWEYTLFDAGWWTPGLRPIADHARAVGLAPLVWLAASDFYASNKRQAKLDEITSAGAQGIKVDFWCSDRQEAMAAMQALFADAARRKLVVNLHGCTIPRGWQRTWPNLLNAEAVLGVESYFFESRYSEKAAELNTVLPFTRNAIGPMDTTPIACSPKKYPRLTTAAHELATAILFTSGIIHYADQPEFFDTLPAPVRQILQDAPARWLETRCLIGEPGQIVVFARRAKASWFIAGINGTAVPRSVDLDLVEFAALRRRLLVAEGKDAAMQVSATPVPIRNRWQHELPPRGGFILRLDRD